MRQLIIGELMRDIEKIKASEGLTDEQIKNMPIYLGDDEELNGVHDAMFCDYISEANEDYLELIEDNCTNSKFEGRALLIS